ncbi:Tonsoku-like protein [Caenorhabditis elegans]|uniref:Tonsoku-like protein n=1 Tax=Caenorhabditis elegans TaxID=6239 RepID=Q21117_CAEEL|nr:Tonsoku-like protein [Caenorhabditis elegans]CAB00035.4 Tonsoku-like protein [Caenorhabditis elegans]
MSSVKNKKEKEARKCMRNGKFSDAVDKFNEAAHELKQIGDLESAISLCEEGSKLAREHRKYFEGSLCERTLSEIYAELGNRESCLQHIVSFRKLAKECGSRSQEQLSYHVEAWCLQQLFLNGEAERTDIERAIELTKKARELVDLYKSSFKESEPGGAPKVRKAQLFTLEAQLQNQIGNNARAMQLLDKTEGLLRVNDKSMRFEMLRTKCSIAPVNQRVDIAELMDDDASEDKKAQTLCELSHQYLLANRLDKAYKSLAEAYFFHEARFPAHELEDTVKRICIIYRLVKYNKIRKNPQMEPKLSKCQLYEAIGDLYDQYFQTLMAKEKKEYRQFVRDNILMSYQKMLEFKRNDEDALRAYQGMALVYSDLDEHSKSLEMFKNLLELLMKTGATEEKILDTRVSIFGCMCKLDFTDLEPMFNELNGKILRLDTKRELYENWANYWSDKRNEENAIKWKQETDNIPEVVIKNEDDETDVLYWKLSDEDVLERCKEENELLKLDLLTEHQLNKTNDKGETVLHQAAMKSENEAVIERLCRRGCKVNAKDNGGWTPLSEAVAHNQYGNVLVLLRYGAEVNARSAESFMSEESQNSSTELNHSRLTPLMEACTNGYVDIAQLLIDNRASVDLRDSAGWTAYQHLKRFIDENEYTERHLKFAENLKILTANYKAPVNIPPPHPINRIPRIHQEEEDIPPDDVEDGMIYAMAASRKRRNSNNSDNSSNTSKRKQRSEENIKPPNSTPPTTAHSNRKRLVQPSLITSKRVQRQNSSSSLTSNPRNSISPRRSISPTTTVRSAPSVFGGDDDLQIVGFKKLNGRSPLPRKKPTPTIRPVVITPRPPIIQQKSLDIPVKCCFEGNSAEKIQPVMLLFPRTLTISEAKARVLSNNTSISQLKISRAWKQDDVDKCLLGDELTLNHLAGSGQLVLVFQLTAPSADEVYQKIVKNQISDVTNRLKLLSTESELDLSDLYLNSLELLDVTRTLNKCERPQNFSLNLSHCDLSIDDEANLQSVIDECSELVLANTISTTRFSGIFEKPKPLLKKLTIQCIDFREESQIIKVLNQCSNIESLNLSGIRLLANNTSIDTIIPSVFIGMSHLKKLDLSFNSSWISDQIWILILGELKNLEELTINETKTKVEFESDWLSHLCSFSARGSDLHWDSVFETLSVMERITHVDVSYSTVDPSLPQELHSGCPRALNILY